MKKYLVKVWILCIFAIDIQLVHAGFWSNVRQGFQSGINRISEYVSDYAQSIRPSQNKPSNTQVTDSKSAPQICGQSCYQTNGYYCIDQNFLTNQCCNNTINQTATQQCAEQNKFCSVSQTFSIYQNMTCLPKICPNSGKPFTITNNQFNQTQYLNVSWNQSDPSGMYCRIFINASQNINGKQIIYIKSSGLSNIITFQQPSIKYNIGIKSTVQNWLYSQQGDGLYIIPADWTLQVMYDYKQPGSANNGSLNISSWLQNYTVDDQQNLSTTWQPTSNFYFNYSSDVNSTINLTALNSTFNQTAFNTYGLQYSPTMNVTYIPDNTQNQQYISTIFGVGAAAFFCFGCVFVFFIIIFCKRLRSKIVVFANETQNIQEDNSDISQVALGEVYDKKQKSFQGEGIPVSDFYGQRNQRSQKGEQIQTQIVEQRQSDVENLVQNESGGFDPFNAQRQSISNQGIERTQDQISKIKDPLSEWNFALKDDSIKSNHAAHQINLSLKDEDNNSKSMFKLLQDENNSIQKVQIVKNHSIFELDEIEQTKK